jgi:hypothetical protein
MKGVEKFSPGSNGNNDELAAEATQEVIRAGDNIKG